MLLLIVATTLAVYKPRGMTWYGRRKKNEGRGVPRLISAPVVAPRSEGGVCSDDLPSEAGSNDSEQRAERVSHDGKPWKRWVLLGTVGLYLLLVALHLVFGGIPRH